ncbi:MAG: hypothetical protein ABGY41_12890 [Candidatus Poribacteria bacterium]|jgi:Zn finger protein HypA/HybF involved in hydrogenase expression
MGSPTIYTCKKCEYTATVSGGWDVGFIAIIATMHCQDCDELFDVSIGFTPGASAQQVEEARKETWECPQCKTGGLERWYDGYPCPRCEGEMDKQESGLMWD